MQKKYINIKKDDNNNEFEIVQRALFFFGILTLITSNSFNPYELHRPLRASFVSCFTPGLLNKRKEYDRNISWDEKYTSVDI